MARSLNLLSGSRLTRSLFDVFHHNDRVHIFRGESNFLACGLSLGPFSRHLMNKYHIQAQQSYEPLVQLLTLYFCNSDPSFSHSSSISPMYHIDPIITAASAVYALICPTEEEFAIRIVEGSTDLTDLFVLTVGRSVWPAVYCIYIKTRHSTT